MKSSQMQIGYDASILREGIEMDQKTVEMILKFYMAKLPEDQARQLDDLLDEQGSSLNTPAAEKASTPAMDAAFGDKERQEFLRLGPKARKSIRASRTASLRGYTGVAQDSAPAKGAISIRDESMFPNAKRLHRG